MTSEPPIQNLDNIDIVAPRVDGVVELYIIASGSLDASPQTQRLLLDKVQSYLDQIASPEFQAEFKSPGADQIQIIITCDHDVDPVIRLLVERSKPWVKQNNAWIELKGASQAR